MRTDHEFRDTNYKGENSAGRKGQQNYPKNNNASKVSIHATAAPKAGSSVRSNNFENSVRNLENAKFGFHVFKNHDIQKFDLSVSLGQQ